MSKRTFGLLMAVLLWVVLVNTGPVYAQQRVGDRQCGREFNDAEARSWNDMMRHAREASANLGFFTRLADQVVSSVEYYGNVAGNVGQFAACIALR